MMISIYIVFYILFLHWFCDFILQTDKQAKGKSKNLPDLLSHTASYTLVMSVFLIPFIPTVNIIGFALITFLCHTMTDYFTSRLNSKLWQQGKTHWFFVSIGFDQILHYVQLFLTYLLLI